MNRTETAKLSRLTLAILALVGAQAWADDDLYSIRGFGTLAATQTSDSTAGYKVYPQATGDANRLVTDTDSLLGVQLDVASHNDLSATVQVIGRRREIGTFAPQVEWGFVKYKFNSQWQTRVGRVLTPAFMESDYRFVGYAFTPVRTSEIYSAYPLSNHDGADLTYQQPMAGGNLSVSGYAGNAKIEIPPVASGNMSYEGKIAGVATSWESDSLLFRLGYLNAKEMKISGASIPTYVQLQGAVNTAAGLGGGALCPSCSDVSARIGNTITDMKYSLLDVGMRYSNEDWAAWGEYTKVSVANTLINPSNGYTLGLSHAFAPWTPYLVYSRVNIEFDPAAKIPASQIAAMPVPALAGALTAYNGAMQNNNSRASVAVGARWDCYKNMAIKGEVLRVNLDDVTANPNNYPNMAPAGVARATSFNLYSITLDFVF